MSVITSIGTAVPSFHHQQSDILNFMLQQTDFNDHDRRMLKLMYGMGGISNRYSVLPDFSDKFQAKKLFSENKSEIVSIDHRMQVYKENACDLACASIKNAGIELKKITHLISVSCTGMSAPGLDIELVKALGLDTTISRTSVNFMGCYAAIHGLKQADAIVKAEPEAKVLVVLVELCTLHFQNENKFDYLTSNLLFGDGAACFLLESAGKGFEVKQFHSQLFLENEDSMGWQISSAGFLMSLKPEVPQIVENNIGLFYKNAILKNQLSESDIHYWAIHPGGRKILEATAKALLLEKNSLEDSFSILKNYGNMSSCTLVFILKQMLEKEQAGHTFVAGFGPGITMESVVLNRI